MGGKNVDHKDILNVEQTLALRRVQEAFPDGYVLVHTKAYHVGPGMPSWVFTALVAVMAELSASHLGALSQYLREVEAATGGARRPSSIVKPG